MHFYEYQRIKKNCGDERIAREIRTCRREIREMGVIIESEVIRKQKRNNEWNANEKKGMGVQMLCTRVSHSLVEYCIGHKVRRRCISNLGLLRRLLSGRFPKNHVCHSMNKSL